MDSEPVLTTSGPRPPRGSRAGILARSISVRGPRGLAQSTGTDSFAHSSPSPHPCHTGPAGGAAAEGAGVAGRQAATAVASTAVARTIR
ncbi:hypothetical protein ACFQ0B_62865 [Nonomuraea thailandensis]